MLDFILNEKNVNVLFILFAIVLPLGCFAIYLALRRSIAKKPASKVLLVAIGIFGPLTLILWNVYNAIENAYGLDSVRALVINLILFIIIGTVLGLILRAWLKRVYSSASAFETKMPDNEKGEESSGGQAN